MLKNVNLLVINNIQYENMKKGSEILSELLKREGINPNQFAAKIGLKRTQPIYDILSGKIKRISENYAMKISVAFPEYKYPWLMTGEGEMVFDAGIIEKAISMLRESDLSDSRLAVILRIATEDEISNYRNGKEKPTPSRAEIIVKILDRIEYGNKMRLSIFNALKDFLDLRSIEKEFGFSRLFLNNVDNLTHDVISRMFYKYPRWAGIYDQSIESEILYSKISHLEEDLDNAIKELSETLEKLDEAQQENISLKNRIVELQTNKQSRKRLPLMNPDCYLQSNPCRVLQNPSIAQSKH